MATDGGDLGDYDPVSCSKIHGEAARIIRAFGFAGAHVIIIGGLVPSLLVPAVEPGLDPHIGTNDLDLCLSVALVDGDVGEYERLETSLRGAGFRMAQEAGHSVSWRWIGGAGTQLVVEFFCAAAPDRAAGRLYRPGGVVGGKLSALALDAGALISRDVRTVALDIELPDGGGRTRQDFRVAGPAAYLAAKADALRRRNKNKDAYDLVWLAESWPGGQVGLATEIRSSGMLAALGPALAVLAEEFRDLDSAGAVKYGRFVARDSSTRDIHAQRAVGCMRALLSALA